MTERTRRATEASDTHAQFIEDSRPDGPKALVEDGLLDVTIDPNDVRYGHGQFLYPKTGTFQGDVRFWAASASTFAVTTDLMREVVLTLEMMEEEGIEFLPLQQTNVPTPAGFILFPYGVDFTDLLPEENGLKERTYLKGDKLIRGVGDEGGGDRWYIDGFLWAETDRAADLDNELAPGLGIQFLPLTRWRGRDTDRPFRLSRSLSPEAPVPPLVASDISAWTFDKPDQDSWGDLRNLAHLHADHHVQSAYYQGGAAEVRRRMRLLLWATFRWLQDEIWIPEEPDRAARKRMKRARPQFAKAPEDGSILIVDLRAERKDWRDAHGDGEPPWWRTRWVVRGHWARRRYALRDAQGNTVGPTRGPDAVYGETYLYRKVWIEEHEKGPENAPLVLKEKVGVLSR